MLSSIKHLWFNSMCQLLDNYSPLSCIWLYYSSYYSIINSCEKKKNENLKTIISTSLIKYLTSILLELFLLNLDKLTISLLHSLACRCSNPAKLIIIILLRIANLLNRLRFLVRKLIKSISILLTIMNHFNFDINTII